MLSKITKQELIDLIKRDHPSWCEEYIIKIADKYQQTLDSRFDEPLYTFIKTGEETDVKENEFSLYIIGRLNRGISYFDRIILLDEYIKDPNQGRLTILRR